MESHVDRLPESCLAYVISLTSPREASLCAAVSPSFRAAAASDAVWGRFLPPDLPPQLPACRRSASKKDAYFSLCDSAVLVDDGTMRVWLEKKSGAKCYILSARKLSLPWEDGEFSWKWVPHPLSRFAEVAQLVDCTCLDIHAKVPLAMLSPGTVYAAYLIFDMLDNHRGLSFPDQETTVTTGGFVSRHTVCLRPDEASLHNFKGARLLLADSNGDGNGDAPRCPRRRENGWLELEMGQMCNDGSVADGEATMTFEIFGWYPKRGLIVEGIEIRPVCS